MKMICLIAGICITALLCGCASSPRDNGASPSASEGTAAGTEKADSVPVAVMAGASSTSSEPRKAATTTIKDIAPQPSDLSINRTCSADADCASGCCYPFPDRKKCREKALCEERDLKEEACYQQGLYWCIDRCQKEGCGDCVKRVRCVTVAVDGTVSVRVETAHSEVEHGGSCKYSGDYVDAGGPGGYCDQHEGDLIHAKCGISPGADDCLRAYEENVLYMLAKKRSFHSPEGEGSDLWCFRCDAAG